ncbi:MAG: hypothetical protein ABI821_00340 [Pseudomonadota bacterium]
MSNSFRHLRASSLLGCALILTAATAAFAGPARGGAAPKGAPYNLAVDIDAPGAVRAQLDIAIPSLKETLRYKLDAKDGGITGGIYIPPGNENRVSITAFDEWGEPIYQGSGYANIDEKLTREISIQLSGRETKDPLLAKLGTYRLEIGFAMNDGDGYMLQATLLDAYDNHIPFKPDDIQWKLPFEFELLPYSCFRESLCIEFNKPDLQKEIIIACARDITCWGKKPKDTRGPYRYVTVGRNHTCALTIANDIRCWGDNKVGQLGATTASCPFNSNFRCSLEPVNVECQPGEICKFRSVAAGGDHTCAIDTNGKAWCWGEDGNEATGEQTQNSGLGLPEHRRVPATNTSGNQANLVSIDTNRFHTCAVSTFHEVWCWGANGRGESGYPQTVNNGTPFAKLVVSNVGYQSVTTGDRHTCAIQWPSSRLDCWGENFDRQLGGLGGVALGAGGMFIQQVNLQVPQLKNTGTSISASGLTSSCAQTTDGDTVCWGSPSTGFFFSQSTAGWTALHRSFASSISTDSNSCPLPGVSVDCTRICATALAGDMFCGNWLSASPSQLTLVPEPQSDHVIVYNEVDVGPNHVCGVTSQQDVWCFGKNDLGQFGTGVNSALLTSAPVLPANK